MNNDFRTYSTRLDTDVCFSSTKFEKRLFLTVTKSSIDCSHFSCACEHIEQATFMSAEKAKEVLKSISSSFFNGGGWNPTRVESRSRVCTETYNQFTVVDLPPDECKCKCDLDMVDIVDDVWLHPNDWVVIEDTQLADILTDRICAMRGHWCADEIYDDVLENIRECIAYYQRYDYADAGDTVLFDTLIHHLITECDLFTKHNVNLTGFDECRGTDNILVVRT